MPAGRPAGADGGRTMAQSPSSSSPVSGAELTVQPASRGSRADGTTTTRWLANSTRRAALAAAAPGPVVLGARDERGVAADPGEELAGLGEQVFEGLVRRREEVGDGAALPGGQAALAGEVVDEVAVAPVGGDAARGRVRLHEVAVALEDRHLIADGGA